MGLGSRRSVPRSAKRTPSEGDDDGCQRAAWLVSSEAFVDAPGFVMVDASGRIAAIDATARALLGASEVQARGGARLLDFFDRPSAERLAPTIAAGSLPTTSTSLRVHRAGDGAPLSIAPCDAMLRGEPHRGFTVRPAGSEALSLDGFRLAIEAAPTGKLVIDASGTIVLVNRRAEALFGYARAELLGKPLELLVPERYRVGHRSLRAAFVASPSERSMGSGRELFGLCADGTEVPIEIGLQPFEAGGRRLVLAYVIDIRQRREAALERERLLDSLRELNVTLAANASRLEASLRERETMLAEIYHRVKNNLQIVSSLMRLQMRTLDEPSAKIALMDCDSRVRTMALIHEQLYAANDLRRVELGGYLRRLTTQLVSAYEETSARVRLELEISPVELGVDRAIPCGLIVNELVTNALRHAFPGDRRGTISVSLKEIDDRNVQLIVADDGIGAGDLRPDGAKGSLGLVLVDALVTQLGGRLESDGLAGVRRTLQFTKEADDVRH